MNEITIPSIYEAEYADTKAKIIENTTEDSLNFLFITDMHIDLWDMHDCIIRQCNAIIKLTKETRIDFILIGGDIIHGIIEKSRNFEYFKEYVDLFSKTDVPVIAVRGNHDDNAYHNEGKPAEIKEFSWEYIPTHCIISAAEWSQRVGTPLAKGKAVKDKNNKDSSYFYVDFEDKKTRVITLDSYDYIVEENERGYARYSAETWDRLSDEQMKWFAETALDPNKDGWNYIIASHNHLTDSGIVKTFGNSETVCAILEAFNNKTAFESDEYGIKVDFTNNTSKAILSIFGHTHRDFYTHDKRTGMLFLGSGNAKPMVYECSNSVYEYATCEPRERETHTEALFDCVICKKDGSVTKIRFGAGNDQFLKRN